MSALVERRTRTGTTDGAGIEGTCAVGICCTVDVVSLTHVSATCCEHLQGGAFRRIFTKNMKTLTEVFPCFFLGCKANARVILAKTGHGPHSSKIVVLFYVLFVSSRSMYCLCVNVYCTAATVCQPNCS